MTAAQWSAAVDPKIAGTRNLHTVFSAETSLDFFIMLSSANGVVGAASQANYAASNTFLDAIARHRASLGLPAVVLDLGMANSVGIVAESAAVAERLIRGGHRPLEEAQVHDLIDWAIRDPNRTARNAQVVTGLAGSTLGRVDAGWARERRFAGLRETTRLRPEAGARGKESTNLAEQIAAASSTEEAEGVVEKAVMGKLADMFVIPESDIDPRQPLSKYGVDSLVAVELRNWLVPRVQCEMSIFELLGSSSLGQLAQKVVEKKNR